MIGDVRVYAEVRIVRAFADWVGDALDAVTWVLMMTVVRYNDWDADSRTVRALVDCPTRVVSTDRLAEGGASAIDTDADWRMVTAFVL